MERPGGDSWGIRRDLGPGSVSHAIELEREKINNKIIKNSEGVMSKNLHLPARKRRRVDAASDDQSEEEDENSVSASGGDGDGGSGSGSGSGGGGGGGGGGVDQ